jgi:hypothetical protein
LKVTAEYNLAKLHPHLAEEWHPTKNGSLKPTDFLPGSNEKVWWSCNQGHEWKASIGERTRSDGKATGCPKCYQLRRKQH